MTTNRRQFWLRPLLVGWLLLIPVNLVSIVAEDEMAEDATMEVVAGGLKSGDKVPNFYVRAITGPLQSKSVCYVCRNGDRPVAMILVRRIIPELETLLKGIDRVVDGHRAEGLRSFAVFVSRDSRTLLPQVQTLAFNGKIGLPMTIAAAPTEGPGFRGLPDDVAVSVVLYRDLKVRHSFSFHDDELTRESIDRVLEAARDLATSSR
ncbi:MAG: hypothetical protein NT069_13935 [Planctomycetota bacterium]|nr:hypothetical protein [Planctomycetota bacterium]